MPEEIEEMEKIKKVTVALFAGALLFCGCSRQEEQPMTRALKEAVAGKWSKADLPSAEALKRTPDNVNALVLRAVICERLDRYDEAVENARKAVNIDSNSFAALYTLGRLYSRDYPRRRSEAVDLLIKANRLRPGDGKPLILLANLHQPGQKGSYLAALQRLPEYANDPHVIFESHMNRIYNRDFRGVEAAYVKLFEEHPDDPRLTSAIGGFFEYYRRYELARKAYRRYLSFPGERREAGRSAEIQRRLQALAAK